ncbi:9988_t:CDS:2, partial [Racocetra fulgida]
YISHYSDSSVVENLDVLRSWPLDDDIKGIIHHAYKQATALARDVLGMVLNTQIHDFVAFPNDDKVEVENEIEEQSAELQRDENLQITESIFISTAASEVNAWDKFSTLTELEEEEDFSDGCSQLDLILDSTQQSQNLNVEMDIDIGVIDGKLELAVLINQRRSHEAYTNQRMERKVVGSSKSIPNNKFSSLISYLSSNESARSGVPRQNRWRMRARLERLNDGIKNSV